MKVEKDKPIRLIGKKIVRQKLGGISNTTLHVLRHSKSPLFPSAKRLRNRPFWDEQDIDAYIAALPPSI